VKLQAGIVSGKIMAADEHNRKGYQFRVLSHTRFVFSFCLLVLLRFEAWLIRFCPFFFFFLRFLGFWREGAFFLFFFFLMGMMMMMMMMMVLMMNE
jgi:hypothetical protein